MNYWYLMAPSLILLSALAGFSSVRKTRGGKIRIAEWASIYSVILLSIIAAIVFAVMVKQESWRGVLQLFQRRPQGYDFVDEFVAEMAIFFTAMFYGAGIVAVFGMGQKIKERLLRR